MPETEIDLTALPVSYSLREKVLSDIQDANDFHIFLVLFYMKEGEREKLLHLFLRTYSNADLAVAESNSKHGDSLMPNTSHQVLLAKKKGTPCTPGAVPVIFDQEEIDLFTEILQCEHAVS